MKSLVIYDSLFGNTEKIAQAIRDGFGPDAQLVATPNATLEQLQGIALLAVGSPTHGGMASKPMQEFLAQVPAKGLTGVRTVSFDTGITTQGQGTITRLAVKTFGYAARRIGATLKQKGADLIASETFFVRSKEGPLVEGELERARQWAASHANV